MERIDYLPLGSVVYLEGGSRKLLIISRGLIVKNGDGVVYFDYSGVPYPHGLTDEHVAYFQHDSIVKVVFEGYRDSDDEMAVNAINKYIEDHPDLVRGDVEGWQGSKVNG